MARKLIIGALVFSLGVSLLAGCGRKGEEAAPAVRTIGKAAPDFVLRDTRGKTWWLADLRGKVVFVNFWATWCPPCRAEMPSMEALNRSLPEDRFQMLTILSNDRPEVAEKFTAAMGFSAPVLLDPENRAYRAYGLTGVPETYIVDKRGILREAIIGPMRWDSAEARRLISAYLEE